ncbi:MAG: hypothetical protein KGJ90_06215 [Patescibacteria group bacterium]|nr:hypothetical protein [Patescibacteria group bacterium]
MNIFQRAFNAVKSVVQNVVARTETARAEQLTKAAERLTKAAESAQERARKAREEVIYKPPAKRPPPHVEPPKAPPQEPKAPGGGERPPVDPGVRILAAAVNGEQVNILAHWTQYVTGDKRRFRDRNKVITVDARELVRKHKEGMGWGQAAMDSYGANIAHLGPVQFSIEDFGQWDEDYETDGGY